MSTATTKPASDSAQRSPTDHGRMLGNSIVSLLLLVLWTLIVLFVTSSRDETMLILRWLLFGLGALIIVSVTAITLWREVSAQRQLERLIAQQSHRAPVDEQTRTLSDKDIRAIVDAIAKILIF